jgi:DNA-binding NarL/FixJ family response regulator
VAGEARCLDSALAALNDLDPEIAIICHCPPTLDAFDLVRRVRLAGLDARIALCAADAGQNEVMAALRLDVDGLLPEGMAEQDLIACLDVLAEKGKWISADVISKAFASAADLPGEADTALPSLTARQRQVASLVAQGLSNKQIANTLSLSEGTVKLHLNRIFRRLGVSNRASLAAAVTLQ